jgi:CBS domain-containing protein
MKVFLGEQQANNINLINWMPAFPVWRKAMRVRDVMVSPVITVSPHASVKEVAKIFLERHISAVPVVDEKGKLVGINQ